MRRYAAHPKCVGIGEAGLDYHYNYAPRDVAKRVFRGQIALARELGLPLVIHTRDAEDDTAAILREEMGQGRFSALLHCFTSSRALAETGLELGLSSRFPAWSPSRTPGTCAPSPATFRSTGCWSRPTRRISRPVPHRGRRNEPAFVAETARALAEAKGIAPEALADGDARQHARVFSQARRRRTARLSLRLTILGCGSSAGVPRVGQGWGACDPANPRNRRRRCSVLVERFGAGGATTVLIDTSPDLREQLIDAGVKRLDGVLMTHPHADHTHGIDDLRPL